MEAAIDRRSVELELWATTLDYLAREAPITSQDGRQYVGIAFTGGSYPASKPAGDSPLAWEFPK
jgi:hypothetical protein